MHSRRGEAPGDIGPRQQLIRECFSAALRNAPYSAPVYRQRHIDHSPASTAASYNRSPIGFHQITRSDRPPPAPQLSPVRVGLCAYAKHNCFPRCYQRLPPCAPERLIVAAGSPPSPGHGPSSVAPRAAYCFLHNGQESSSSASPPQRQVKPAPTM